MNSDEWLAKLYASNQIDQEMCSWYDSYTNNDAKNAINSEIWIGLS